MDEESLRKDFDEWLSKNSYQIGLLWECWLESARRADKRAREECAVICEQHEIYTSLDCADFIRSTIQEESV